MLHPHWFSLFLLHTYIFSYCQIAPILNFDMIILFHVYKNIKWKKFIEGKKMLSNTKIRYGFYSIKASTHEIIIIKLKLISSNSSEYFRFYFEFTLRKRNERKARHRHLVYLFNYQTSKIRRMKWIRSRNLRIKKMRKTFSSTLPIDFLRLII